MNRLVLIYREDCVLCNILKPVLEEYVELREDVIYEPTLLETAGEEGMVRIPKMIAYIDDEAVGIRVGADPDATKDEHIEMLDEFFKVFE